VGDRDPKVLVEEGELGRMEKAQVPGSEIPELK
jgi:hypothetical protein